MVSWYHQQTQASCKKWLELIQASVFIRIEAWSQVLFFIAGLRSNPSGPTQTMVWVTTCCVVPVNVQQQHFKKPYQSMRENFISTFNCSALQGCRIKLAAVMSHAIIGLQAKILSQIKHDLYKHELYFFLRFLKFPIVMFRLQHPSQCWIT